MLYTTFSVLDKFEKNNVSDNRADIESATTGFRIYAKFAEHK